MKLFRGYNRCCKFHTLGNIRKTLICINVKKYSKSATICSIYCWDKPKPIYSTLQILIDLTILAEIKTDRLISQEMLIKNLLISNP